MSERVGDVSLRLSGYMLGDDEGEESDREEQPKVEAVVKEKEGNISDK